MTTTDENPNRRDWGAEFAEVEPDIRWSVVAGESLSLLCYSEAVKAGHYNDPETGEQIRYTVPQLIHLAMRELHEAREVDMDGAMDKHLPHRLGVEVEIADAIIILFGACGHLGLDIGNAMAEKLEYNRTRKAMRLNRSGRISNFFIDKNGRLERDEDGDAYVMGGAIIDDTIKEAMGLISDDDETISFKFSGVVVKIRRDSNVELIERDYMKAAEGDVVGPCHKEERT